MLCTIARAAKCSMDHGDSRRQSAAPGPTAVTAGASAIARDARVGRLHLRSRVRLVEAKNVAAQRRRGFDVEPRYAQRHVPGAGAVELDRGEPEPLVER